MNCNPAYQGKKPQNTNKQKRSKLQEKRNEVEGIIHEEALNLAVCLDCKRSHTGNRNVGTNSRIRS